MTSAIRHPRKDILLPVKGGDGSARVGWPVTQGVPLPDGMLERGGPVRLRTPDGIPVPLQTECLATWGPDRRFVKWLLVDFPAEIKAGKPGGYCLELNSEQASALPEHAVGVTDSKQLVTVRNGLVELVLQRDTADFFRDLSVIDSRPDSGRRSLLCAARRPHLRVKLQDRLHPDAAPLECCSDTGSFAPLISVEATGPVRASVAVRGYHFSPEGLRVCPYVLRLHVYANRPDIRLEHTLIFDQSPDRFAISAFGMCFPLGSDAPGRTGWVGDEQGTVAAGMDYGEFGFMQTSDDQYRIVGDCDPARGGRHAPGWIACGGVAAALCETWREYPVGLRFRRGDNRRGSGPSATLLLDFWPEAAGQLDLASPFAKTSHWIRDAVPLPDDAMKKRLEDNPDVPLDLHFARFGSNGPDALDRCERLRDQLARLAPDRPYAFSNTDVAGACGMAKTHGVWLRFSKDELDPASIESLAKSAQNPLLALPDPDTVCVGGAVRLLHPHDPERFPEVECALDSLFEKLVLEPEEACRIHGKFDYGDLINGHNVNNPVVYRSVLRSPDAWPGVMRQLGTFNNESQDVIRQLWSFYLRTGRPGYFRFAAAKSRHTLDVDFVHRLPRDAQVHPYPNHPARVEGQMHYHSATHWSGPYVTSHSLVSGIVTHYLLTGERRAREVVLAMADSLVRNQTPNGLIREGGLHREITGGLCTLLEAWQLTWAESYRTLALNTLRMLHAVRNATGNLPGKVFTGGGADGTTVEAEGCDNRTNYPGGMLWYVLYDAHLLFEEPWIKDWILQLAESWISGVPCDDVLPAERTAPVAEGGLTVHEITPGWLWHSWLSFPNFFFDPLIVLAWQWTRDPRYLGYLAHRARVFPSMALDAARCFTGHAFNVINHAGEAVPSILSALAEAGGDVCLSAWMQWKAERAEDGFPVSDGPYSGYDAQGDVSGRRQSVAIQTGVASGPPPGSVAESGERRRHGEWDPRIGRFAE